MKRKTPSQDAGDPDAAGEAEFVAFYWRNLEIMAAALRRILRPHEVDDVLQKAFIKVFEHRARLREIENEAGWAKTVALRAAFDHLKAKRRLREVAVAINPVSDAADLADALDARRQLESIAAGLTPDERRLLELVVDGGAAGAAEVLGIPKASVRRKIHNIRVRVNAWLFESKEGETR